MKKFWKWFFIVLGILVVIGIAFCVTLLFLHGAAPQGRIQRGFNAPGGFTGRDGMIGGMMLGMGFLMFLRWLIPLGVLVLAGFGVAYLVNRPRKPEVLPPATVTCASCGKPLAADWKACPYCGAPVQASEPVAESAAAPAEAEKPKGKSKTKAS